MIYTANNTLNYQINKSTDFLKVDDWKTDFLCDYIESNHHNYIRKMIPKILSLCKSLVRKKLMDSDICKEIQQFGIDLEAHMQKEERLIFPYIKKLNSISDYKEEYEIPPFGSIVNLIKVIEKEHIITSKTLFKIKNEFSVYKTKLNEDTGREMLYDLMNKFDSDFQIHVHFEKNILYPKAISLEKKLKKNFFKNKNIN